MNHSILTSLLLLIGISNVLSQEEECVFDESTQTDEFIRDVQAFKNYTWNNDTKEATILLDSGDTLITKRGGCDHFELSGTLITHDSTNLKNPDYWLEKGLWIAKRIFQEADFKELETIIYHKTYSKEPYQHFLIYISFPHDYYSEYCLTLKQKNHGVELYIGYYFN